MTEAILAGEAAVLARGKPSLADSRYRRRDGTIDAEAWLADAAVYDYWDARR
jgi:hypothetical protein